MKYLMGLVLVFMLTAYGQQRYLVTPSNEAIPLQQGESALEVVKRASILSQGNYTRGFKSVEWKPLNVASGLFFYKLTTEKFTQVRKMLLIR